MIKNTYLTLVLLATIAILNGLGFAAPGDLDTSFSGDGKLTMQFGEGESEGFATAQQSDGKIVMIGNAALGSNTIFAVARYNSDGSLDNTFDGDGKTYIDFESGNSAFAQDLVIQTDGKIVVVGSTGILNTTYRFAIARLNTNGSLDTSFDTDGKVITDFSGSNTDIARCIAIQSDGKIVVGGSALGLIGGNNFALARYNSDGSLDSSFDSDGVLITDFSGFGDEATGIAIQSDGKILLAGTTIVNSTVQVGVARYNSDGTLDTSFDGDGKLFTGHGGSGIGAFASGTDVVLQSDGKIVISVMAGNTPQFGVVRLNSNGTVDGTARTTILAGSNIPRAIKLQTDEKIIVVGSTTASGGGGEDFAAVRFNTDLTLDTTFSGDGKVRTDFNATSGDIPSGLVIQPDGSLVLAGTFFDGSPRKFASLRYSSDGTLDTTFDSDGKRTDNMGFGVSSLKAVAMQTDGKIVAVGSQLATTNSDFAVYRFNPNGTLDSTFDGDGIATTDFSNGSDVANSLLIQPDGKILVGGGNDSAPLGTLIARYNTNGSLDTTFDGDGKLATGFSGNTGGGANAVVLEPSGKIIVAGFRRTFSSGPADFTIFRISSTGFIEELIATDIFGGNDVPRGIALQSDGKLLVASNGFEDSNQDFAIIRYNSDLTLDTTFSGDGMAFVDFGPGDDLANSLAVQSDGKIVITGSASNGANLDIGVARLNSNGSLDTTFSGDGKATVAPGSGDDAGNSVKIETIGGKILVGGFSGIGLTKDFAVVRFNPDGTLDNTALWGAGGISTTDLGSEDLVNSLAIQSDGKVIAAGESGGILALTRYQNLSPTAAESSISGRVTTASGRGIGSVTIQISGGNLNSPKFTRTNPFGFYRFTELDAGQTYVLNVASKRYSFANSTRVISLNEDLTGEDFVSDNIK